MSRYPRGVIWIATLLTALLAGAASSTPGSSAAGAPALRVESASPLVVRGTNFRGGERVTVTVATGTGPVVVTVRARNGSFRVALSTPPAGCKSARFVRARGDKGSVASVVVHQGFCIPPPRR